MVHVHKANAAHVERLMLIIQTNLETENNNNKKKKSRRKHLVARAATVGKDYLYPT